MKKYALKIDHESCWGCRTCEVACKQENQSAEGVKLIEVAKEGPRMEKGKPVFAYRINVCLHCEEPPCMDACPDEAIVRREDQIVVLDDGVCSGCEACIEACPYDVIAFDVQRGLARKCNLCHHRVDNGLLPACADNICLAHCIFFGDPEKVVSDTQ